MRVTCAFDTTHLPIDFIGATDGGIPQSRYELVALHLASNVAN